MSARLQACLLTVIECATRENQSAPISPDIRQALEYIADNVERSITLEQLADVAGLSVSRFKAKFRQQVGSPPGECVLRAKTQRAAKLLRETAMSITAVAHRLGFSSSQYFATVFKRYMHIQPTTFRADSRGTLP
jgi:AraC-like DNA-binding protein